MGRITTNRHKGLDIMMHFQTVGQIPPKFWEGNFHYLRFHYQDTNLKRLNKIGGKTALLHIAMNIVAKKFREGNPYFFVWLDVLNYKMLNIDKETFYEAAKLYIIINRRDYTLQLAMTKDTYPKLPSHRQAEIAQGLWIEQKYDEYCL